MSLPNIFQLIFGHTIDTCGNIIFKLNKLNVYIMRYKKVKPIIRGNCTGCAGKGDSTFLICNPYLCHPSGKHLFIYVKEIILNINIKVL